MGFFSKAACLVGSHDWEEWKYKSEDQCLQARRCKREGCQKTEERTEHEWKAWEYLSANSCEQKRYCRRNSSHSEDRKAEHQWTSWEYLKRDLCDQERKCTRCGTPGKRVEHKWGVWEYEAPRSCKKVRICHRCHDREVEKSYEITHDEWGDWDYSTSGSCTEIERYCLRCRKRENKLDFVAQFHDWEEQARPRGTIKVCRNCGKGGG